MSAKFEDFLQDQLQNPEFRQESEALQPERAAIQAMMDARKYFGYDAKGRVCTRIKNNNLTSSIELERCDKSGIV